MSILLTTTSLNVIKKQPTIKVKYYGSTFSACMMHE